MKTLILFRHGKSDWGADFARDHERPLKKRGVKAARAMGVFLHRAGQVPDSAVCSTALRARTTLELAAEAGSWPTKVRLTDNLYASEPDRVLAEVRAESDDTSRLILVGHEPTWSEMVRLLAQAQVRFSTACMSRIDLPIESWKEADFGAGELIWHLPPKLLTKGDFDLTD